MGNYSAIRGKIKIKPEYKELIELINEGRYAEATQKFPFVKDFYKIERSDSIPIPKDDITIILESDHSWSPKGTLGLDGAAPHDWQINPTYFTNLNDDLEWTFISSLKDYIDLRYSKSPIDAFIEVIVETVIDELILIETCSDSEYGKVYKYEFDKEIINKLTPICDLDENEDYNHWWH